MLQTLQIRNLALLEDVELEFGAGFTAVTGETGAGKSILLGGLSLLAGERADKSVVRQGAAACDVSAAIHFADDKIVNELLEELGLPACEEGVLVLRRTVAVDKPQKVSVNGSLATLAALQRLGERWIDFHGPSEPRRLLKENCQLELLDLFARDQAALAAYHAAYRNWRAALAERDRLTEETALAPEQVEFLRQELRRFEAVDLADEAIEGLERDHHRLSRAQELIALASAAAAGLGGEEGAQGRLALALREARRVAEIDPASAPLAERLGAAVVEINDLAAEFESLGQTLAMESEAAEALEARMNVWLEIKRRHGPDAAHARAAHEALKQRLEVQGDLAGAVAAAEQQAAATEKRARAAATVLRGQREKAAKEFSRAASKEIAQLGFAKAAFEARIKLHEDVEAASPPLQARGEAAGRRFHGGLGPEGDCACEFLFSPNVGEEPRVLARIASSGELARVMLALKAVLADLDGVPVLVFDEVDANVGGEIGRVVGEKMAAIGRSHQVLCVTHLPQVAAQAANHLVVEKDQSKSRAVVTIRPIHEQRKARVSELARMLGDRAAKSALAHAEDLLGR